MNSIPRIDLPSILNMVSSTQEPSSATDMPYRSGLANVLFGKAGHDALQSTLQTQNQTARRRRFVTDEMQVASLLQIIGFIMELYNDLECQRDFKYKEQKA